MTETNLHVGVASEEVDAGGFTGRLREVAEAVITDYGGNVLAGPGPANVIVKRARRFRVPVRVMPTVLGAEVASAHHLVSPHSRS